MDDGRILTITQKRRILGLLLALMAAGLTVLALWFCLGRPDVLLRIALLLAGGAAMIILSTVCFLLFRRCTPQMTYRVRRRIRFLLFLVLALAAVPALIWLVREIRSWDWAALIPDISADPSVEGKQWKLPGLQLEMPRVRFGFWQGTFAVLGVVLCLCAFGNGLGRGIVSIPALVLFEILLISACSGGIAGNDPVFWRCMAYAAGILLVSGLLLRDFSGVFLLLALLRILVPVTLAAAIAVWLQTENPVSAPPVDFRAVYHWILLITMFLAQSYQLCSPSFPEPEYTEYSDDPIPHMLGNEYEDGTLDP